jgi:hypothetical protein
MTATMTSGEPFDGNTKSLPKKGWKTSDDPFWCRKVTLVLLWFWRDKPRARTRFRALKLWQTAAPKAAEFWASSAASFAALDTLSRSRSCCCTNAASSATRSCWTKAASSAVPSSSSISRLKRPGGVLWRMMRPEASSDWGGGPKACIESTAAAPSDREGEGGGEACASSDMYRISSCGAIGARTGSLGCVGGRFGFDRMGRRASGAS